MQNEPSTQWQEWMYALVEADYRVRVVDPAVIESYRYEDVSADVILFDGMLPLKKLISRIGALCPETKIVVATETNFFSIRYEVMHLGGALYLFGPMPPDEFIETIQGTFVQEMVA
jgi:DNA-binding NarL/FixJ family response regulator